MGQKTNPISNRLGIIKGWESNWFGGKNFSEKIVEDNKIRKYLNARLAKASISKIIIERTLKLITVTVHTARPGIIIGKGGQEVDKLKEELRKILGIKKTDGNHQTEEGGRTSIQKDVQINIFEIKRPELDANIVANNIARQVEGKISYRRAMKTAIVSTIRMGAEGIKIIASGRLGGAEMARTEMLKEGRIPLHTFRADIDFSLAEALTKVGLIGIKVWICNGEVYGKRDLSPNFTTNYAASQQGGNSRPRGEYRERNDHGDRDNNRGDRRDRKKDRNRNRR
jgi:small subunit ribosomal protein S3